MEPDKNNNLTEEEIDKIVAKAVDKAFEKIAAEVGKSVLKRGFMLLGMAAIALYLWFAGGHVPK